MFKKVNIVKALKPHKILLFLFAAVILIYVLYSMFCKPIYEGLSSSVKVSAQITDITTAQGDPSPIGIYKVKIAGTNDSFDISLNQLPNSGNFNFNTDVVKVAIEPVAATGNIDIHKAAIFPKAFDLSFSFNAIPAPYQLKYQTGNVAGTNTMEGTAINVQATLKSLGVDIFNNNKSIGSVKVNYSNAGHYNIKVKESRGVTGIILNFIPIPK